MVTHRGIEVNPDQVMEINSLHLPQNPKEVQKLTGMTAALNQFIFGQQTSADLSSKC